MRMKMSFDLNGLGIQDRTYAGSVGGRGGEGDGASTSGRASYQPKVGAVRHEKWERVCTCIARVKSTCQTDDVLTCLPM
jgi:hypothetical protein